jgi:hypothetical protein
MPSIFGRSSEQVDDMKRNLFQKAVSGLIKAKKDAG